MLGLKILNLFPLLPLAPPRAETLRETDRLEYSRGRVAGGQHTSCASDRRISHRRRADTHNRHQILRQVEIGRAHV